MAGCSILSPTPSEDIPVALPTGLMKPNSSDAAQASDALDSTDIVQVSATEPEPSKHVEKEDVEGAEQVSSFKRTAFGEKQEVKKSGLQTPSVPAPQDEKPIDLATALRLGGVDNPTINLARECITEAIALQLSARVMLLPSLTVGGNYHAHFGDLQRSSGQILDVNSSSFYFGFGARTVAAESVAYPGFRIFAHLGDAYFEPLATLQQVTTRRALAGAVQNRVLRDVAEAYLNLLSVEAQLEVARSGETELAEIVRLAVAYAKAGQGREGDAQRAKSRNEFLRRDIEGLEGELEVASARLAELLSLDPSVRLRTPGGKVPTIQLIDQNQELERLLNLALDTRPEIVAQTAAVLEARTRVRQERVRPFLPTLSIGLSYGEFAGGSNLVAENPQAFLGRTDIDVFATWTLQNLATGNIAMRRRASSVLGQSIDDLNRTRNEIRDQAE